MTNIENDIVIADLKNMDDVGDLPGIISALGQLGAGAVITEEGMAHLFHRHPASVKRAVQRGELPPPCRMFGNNAWTAGILVQHIEQRLEAAAAERERIEQKIARLSP